MPLPGPDTVERVGLAPMLADRRHTALLWDVDGTLAPIVAQADQARVPEEASRLLGRLASQYGFVACVSGRQANDARRLVGVGAITYAGSHGLELLAPGALRPTIAQEAIELGTRVAEFVNRQDESELRQLRIRIEDKHPIWAFHWRGAPDEDEAQQRVKQIAEAATAEGLHVHHGRKVIELRPPIAFDKGAVVERMLAGSDCRFAVYCGDDRTDVDAFRALTRMEQDGRLKSALRVGVESPELPAEVTNESDLLVSGTQGVLEILRALAS